MTDQSHSTSDAARCRPDLVDKDWHSERRFGEVCVQVVEVVLPLALPGKVHKGGPFEPPHLYQPPLFINSSIVTWHLNHDISASESQCPRTLLHQRQPQTLNAISISPAMVVNPNMVTWDLNHTTVQHYVLIYFRNKGYIEKQCRMTAPPRST